MQKADLPELHVAIHRHRLRRRIHGLRPSPSPASSAGLHPVAAQNHIQIPELVLSYPFGPVLGAPRLRRAVPVPGELGAAGGPGGGAEEAGSAAEGVQEAGEAGAGGVLVRDGAAAAGEAAQGRGPEGEGPGREGGEEGREGRRGAVQSGREEGVGGGVPGDAGLVPLPFFSYLLL